MRRRRSLLFAVSLLVLMALAAVRASDQLAGGKASGQSAGPKASGQDETILTVQVSAAEHEVAEGYFSLGDSATVMVKPGTDLYKFLARQRGRSVKITFVENAGHQLSRLDKGR
jgi:hypothetical protein